MSCRRGRTPAGGSCGRRRSREARRRGRSAFAGSAGLEHAHRAPVVTRSRSAVSGVTYALSGSAGSIGIGKPNADGNPTAMSVQLSPVSLER